MAFLDTETQEHVKRELQAFENKVKLVVFTDESRRGSWFAE